MTRLDQKKQSSILYSVVEGGITSIEIFQSENVKKTRDDQHEIKLALGEAIVGVYGVKNYNFFQTFGVIVV